MGAGGIVTALVCCSMVLTLALWQSSGFLANAKSGAPTMLLPSIMIKQCPSTWRLALNGVNVKFWSAYFMMYWMKEY
jgi:hypothetical protein